MMISRKSIIAWSLTKTEAIYTRKFNPKAKNSKKSFMISLPVKALHQNLRKNSTKAKKTSNQNKLLKILSEVHKNRLLCIQDAKRFKK